jgi:hypothetical protein
VKRMKTQKTKAFAILILIVCSACESRLRATDTRSTALSPVLVELFTSEGCSSCPPADVFLQKMDAAQPIPGAELIVLSEHVDYWNHDGWKDPYSSSLLTERQSAYVRALGLPTPYTPQIIVDGTKELKLNDPQQVAQFFAKAADTLAIPVRIGAASVQTGAPSILRAHVDIDGALEKHNAEIYAVVALDHAESEVLHGENGGRHLAHVAVVEDLTRIGKLEKGKSFGNDFQLQLKPGTDPENLRIIVFVQEAGPGKVVGAALKKSIH